ncbi:Retrovirus-related Pol polyprotein from transposon TNT 1-94 [Melia azedarach]|uniref:Retrovirus-related Pol polyprotein from transposon TNT 1-94 n=1 Tax=Melia azedarach TaxID=155640 RepID=A0ACC1X5L3_MELAZ|nr:Retrovirus-related Pol polyprotein from transposon TNT 1-94 [Melia azedarach]
MATHFSLKDLGTLSYFLGVEAASTAYGLFLSQQKYIRDLLSKTNMLESKEMATPLSLTETLKLNDGSPNTDLTQYRHVVGPLQYLSLTRPDISFAVNKLSQFMHCPSSIHWSAVKRLLRYLKGTSHHGLLIRKQFSPCLHAFTDSDWAGNPDDRTFTYAFIVFLGVTPISWSSKKQRTVARSSTEAEHRAVASTAVELNWIMNLLQELCVHIPFIPAIYCDNIGATYLCKNPVFHSRMKHIAIDFYFVRDQVLNKRLRVSHVHTHDQLADSLTKTVSRKQFLLHRSKIGIHDGSTIL